MLSGTVKWAIFLLIGFVTAVIGSLVAQAPHLDHGVFFLLILGFLAACAWHSLQAEKTRTEGGNTILVLRRTVIVSAGRAVVTILLLVCLGAVYRVASSQSLSDARAIHEVLLWVTFFFALLLLQAQSSEARVYDRGIWLRGYFLPWDAIDRCRWLPEKDGALLIERKQGLPVGRLLRVQVAETQVPTLSQLLAERFPGNAPTDPPARKEPEISILP